MLIFNTIIRKEKANPENLKVIKLIILTRFTWIQYLIKDNLLASDKGPRIGVRKEL